MSDINVKKKPISPIPLAEMLFADYGADAERVLRGYACSRPVTLRVNRLKGETAEGKRALSELKIPFEEAGFYEDALILRETDERELRETRLYREGLIYLQSLSSMLPPLILAPRAGETVLDMTAAPGGKTTELAALSFGKALITACERDGGRFERLKFNLMRQGATRVNAMHTDALGLDDGFRFDKILLDAPCSGSGRLHGGETIDEKLLKGCMRTQSALLKKGLKLLKKGGRLLYSTCSILKCENEAPVLKAIAEGGARLIPIEENFGFSRLESAAGTVTVCPDDLFEGFFLALIEKI